MKFKTTAEVPVPEKLVDQVIGQDKAVEIVKKAAKQKRHVLLIGSPGTGKSMLAQAMAELMESEDLEDVIAYPNPNNENQPAIRVVKTYPDPNYIKTNGLMRLYSPKEMEKIKQLPKPDLAKALRVGLGRRLTFQRPDEEQKGPPSSIIIGILAVILIYVIFSTSISDSVKWFILATVLGIGVLFVLSNATAGLGKRLMPRENSGPKLIIDNSERSTAPFIDATGSRAGSLLGDVKHDPLQSGGLGNG